MFSGKSQKIMGGVQSYKVQKTMDELRSCKAQEIEGELHKEVILEVHQKRCLSQFSQIAQNLVIKLQFHIFQHIPVGLTVRKQSLVDNIDAWAMWISPPVFILFNFIYWISYRQVDSQLIR